ncbi:MAG: AAA family ATPase [Nanoarchaeota archaeon]|nr:AAA family ATPase [Nanoarchaeota archaeon]
MRVAITGTAGTGKTTLGNLISSNTSLTYIPDINDIVLREMGYESGTHLFKERGEEGMIEWHMNAIKSKIESDTERDKYIADKSIFDFGARWFARMYSSAKKQNHEYVLSCLEKGKDLYDKIIFLPLDFNRSVANDGMRTTDLFQRFKFNIVLQGLYKEFKVNIEEYDFDFASPPEKVIRDLKLDSLAATIK